MRLHRALGSWRCALLPGIVLVGGCGSEAPSSRGPVPKAETTLVFRHGAVPGFERYFHHLYQEFSRENPGLAVRDEVLPSNTDQQHQLYAINLEGGTDAFDLMGMDIIWLAEFARAGWSLDLSPWFTEGKRAGFLDSTVRAAEYGGGVYGVPWFTDAGLLYYRKDLLDKYGHAPPETWGELVRIAKDVLEKEGDPRLVGFVWQGKQYEGMVCDAVEYLGSNGVRFLDEKGRWAVDGRKAAEALGFMRGLVAESGVSPELVLAADEETGRQIFGNGEAVFMRNWPYAYGIYGKPASLVRGKVGIEPLPHFLGGHSVGTLGGWFIGVNAHSRHPEAAFKFIEYMTSPKVQRDLFERMSYLPTRKSLYRDPELLRLQPQLAQFGRILRRTQPRPVTPFYSGLSDILQGEFSAVLAGMKEPEDALEAIRIQVEPIIGTAPRAPAGAAASAKEGS